MKSAIYISAVILSASALAAPTFVTGRMIDRRNGLTDEQYEMLWAQGKNPAISQAAARDWIFRAGRYQNVTNWLDICGATNNFAALSYDLQDKNFVLAATNETLVAINNRLMDEVSEWMVKSATFSNAVVVAQGRLAAATAKINAELNELKADKADLEAKIADTKYILLRPWLKTKLAAVEARIKVLEALTANT